MEAEVLFTFYVLSHQLASFHGSTPGEADDTGMSTLPGPLNLETTQG